MIITFTEGSSFVYIISYSLLAGALGFLFLNFPPAKIILGDVGAAFLGFVFAVLAIIFQAMLERNCWVLVDQL